MKLPVYGKQLIKNRVLRHDLASLEHMDERTIWRDLNAVIPFYNFYLTKVQALGVDI